MAIKKTHPTLNCICLGKSHKNDNLGYFLQMAILMVAICVKSSKIIHRANPGIHPNYHSCDSFDRSGSTGCINIPVLKRSLDFTFWFSISPELEQRTQEVIHKKYGGREKAERAARIIQESYRQYRLRQSFHKLR